MRKIPMNNPEAKDKFDAAGIDVSSDIFKINGRGTFIPADVWRMATGKQFTPQLKKGTQVVLRKWTKRQQRQRRAAVAVDNNRFLHYGIGSGKTYRTAEDFDPKYRGPVVGNNSVRVQNRFILNPRHAISKAESLTNIGYHTIGWRGDKQPVHPAEFTQFTNLSTDGVFGPKKIILGAITEVYVYINRWYSTRREGRYRVQWECGSEGIFTADYLDKTFCTDYDLDEELWACERSDYCKNMKCKEHGVHVMGKECGPGGYCVPSGEVVTCKKVLDYTHFMDTTVGTGIID